eukprot:CAMPEP_0168539868 /NCGR_PEP_ID=MMETSP0405-20121227/22105_1 /TAXON_ID=498012 /ORGANISM="Trichosphaerium sp, Strain Am-I-7 wt" /LENGTH=410 /DNA_ID=CAMNT_0008569555 /DNA_START=563 /DNA_END=1792 /DNA_ORIENTATION=+
MMFDTKLKGNPKDLRLDFPIAAPLPLAPTKLDGNLVDLYSKWNFALPDYVIDLNTNGCVWQLDMDLKFIAISFSDRYKLVNFLLRRENSKRQLIDVLRMIIQQGEELRVITTIFDTLNGVLASYIESKKSTNKTTPGSPRKVKFSPELIRRSNSASASDQDLASSTSEQMYDAFTRGKTLDFWNKFITTEEQALNNSTGSNKDSKGGQHKSQSYDVDYAFLDEKNTIDGHVIIKQEEMYAFVFMPVTERSDVDTKYMVSVLLEYIRSLNFHHITVHSFLYELLINLLVNAERYYQLRQFLQYHVISDSMHVACQLLSLENSYPPAYQLALDMLKRLSKTETKVLDQLVDILLIKGQVLQALRFVKTHKIPAVAKRFLERAKMLNDDTLFYMVYNYFKARKELNDSCSEYT